MTAKPDGKEHAVLAKAYIPLVWLLRLVVGSLFIFSGFVKAVDPWGSIYKIDEYLGVWGVDWVSGEMVTVFAVALAAYEFVCGVMLLSGCLRRAVCILLLLTMAVMLPLTFYIWLYDPVADCGCFGDAIILSNRDTFLKNIGITLCLIYLMRYNNRVACVFAPLVQWLALVASGLYCITLSIVGYNVQPMVDFRPFPVGSQLADDTESELRMVYTRNGERRVFDVDNLPDSTWTYAGRLNSETQAKSQLAIYDGDDDVTQQVIEPEGPQLILMVSDPGRHTKARSGMANALNAYVRRQGGTMISIVAAGGSELEEWKAKARPDYDVYTADDTTIKEIVRGSAGLVYLNDGKIEWKRNLYSLPADFPDFSAPGNLLEKVDRVDSGVKVKRLTFIYLIALFVIYLLGLIKLRDESRQLKDVESTAKDNPTEGQDRTQGAGT